MFEICVQRENGLFLRLKEITKYILLQNNPFTDIPAWVSTYGDKHVRVYV